MDAVPAALILVGVILFGGIAVCVAIEARWWLTERKARRRVRS